MVVGDSFPVLWVSWVSRRLMDSGVVRDDVLLWVPVLIVLLLVWLVFCQRQPPSWFYALPLRGAECACCCDHGPPSICWTKYRATAVRNNSNRVGVFLWQLGASNNGKTCG